MPKTAAQRKSTDAGSRDDATGRCQAKGVGRVVNIAPGTATLCADSMCFGVNSNTFHGRKVNHQTIIACSEATSVVSATSDGKGKLLFTGEVHALHDVGHVNAAGNKLGTLFDHGVIDVARNLIGIVAGAYELAAQLGAKRLQAGLIDALHSRFDLLLRYHWILL